MTAIWAAIWKFVKAHWFKLVIITACALLFVPSVRHWLGGQLVAEKRTAATTAGATNSPTTPRRHDVESGSEARIRELTNHVSRIEHSRDTAIRDAAELRKKLAALEDQLDNENHHLERSTLVRPPTGSVRAERTYSEPEKAQRKVKVPQLEYVWTTSSQVGSISLLGGEVATVTISNRVRFNIDPDPGVVINVLLETGGTIPFAEWQKKPMPVRRFEISNDGNDPRIVLFTPE